MCCAMRWLFITFHLPLLFLTTQLLINWLIKALTLFRELIGYSIKSFVAPTAYLVYQGIPLHRVLDRYSPWISIAKHALHGKQCSPTHIHPLEDSGDGLHTLIIFDNQKDVTQQIRQVAFCNSQFVGTDNPPLQRESNSHISPCFSD